MTARPPATGVRPGGRAPRPRPWRLLIDGAAPGPWNMGIDRVLLASAAAGGPPTLRFYRWLGPWLSIGYAQACRPECIAACAGAGVGVVRRPTGGSAVLHGGDLTYALAAPESALPPGLRASYELIAAALLSALRSLGVDAELGDAWPGSTGAGWRRFDCFAQPAAHELCAGGLKLVGSAQRRAAGAVLQHGSIRVLPDPARARRAAGLDASRATSLRELGFMHSVQAVRTACIAAFARQLEARFQSGSLTPRERRDARPCPPDPARTSSPRSASPWGSQG